MSPRRGGEGPLPLFRSSRPSPARDADGVFVGWASPPNLPSFAPAALGIYGSPRPTVETAGRNRSSLRDRRKWPHGMRCARSIRPCMSAPGGSAPGPPGSSAFRQQHGNHGRTRAACRDADSRIKGRDIFLLSCHWPKLVPAQAGSEGLRAAWGRSPQEHGKARPNDTHAQD
jgi:hypothetical protein